MRVPSDAVKWRLYRKRMKQISFYNIRSRLSKEMRKNFDGYRPVCIKSIVSFYARFGIPFKK